MEEWRSDYSLAYSDLMEALNREMHNPELPEEKRRAIVEFREALTDYILKNRSKDSLISLLSAESEFLRVAGDTEAWEKWVKYKGGFLKELADYLERLAFAVGSEELDPIDKMFAEFIYRLGVEEKKAKEILKKELTPTLTTFYGLSTQLLGILQQKPELTWGGFLLVLLGTRLRRNPEEIVEEIEQKMDILKRSLTADDLVTLLQYYLNTKDPKIPKRVAEIVERVGWPLTDMLAYR